MTASVLTVPEQGGARVSGNGLYRYTLWRRWGSVHNPVACFVMLNPSTADAESDDPTIRRCRSFAKREGCGGFVVVNLFAWRATNPKDLLAVADPVGVGINDEQIRKAVSWCRKSGGPVIAGWGAHKTAAKRAKAVQAICGPMLCLGVTKDGYPRHPLYVKSDAPLLPYEGMIG